MNQKIEQLLAGVFIQIAPHKDLCVINVGHPTFRDHLYIRETVGQRGKIDEILIDLGPATKDRVEFLKDCLDRLKVHCE